MKRVALIALVAALLPTSVGAQRVVEAGDRVMVRDFDGSVEGGVVTWITNEQVELLTVPAASAVVMDRARVESVHISEGMHTRFVDAMVLTTAASSVGVGVFFAYCRAVPCEGSWQGFDELLLGAAIGAVLGIPAGLIAGLRMKFERWTPAALPERVEAGRPTPANPLLPPRTGPDTLRR